MAGERGLPVDEERFRRLERDHSDASEQLAAMSEVLTALGRSSSDPDVVLESVVESARRLCRCDAAAAYLVDGDHFALATSVGALPGLPLADTLKRADTAGNVAGTVDRAGLWRAEIW